MTSDKENNKDFFLQVYDVVRQIPYGKVMTYGHIARLLGAAKSARMVGWAMNASHRLKDVPAHRVVNRKGLLTGKMHFETPETMEKRLKKEGIEVKDDQIIDFEQKLWDPFKDLED